MCGRLKRTSEGHAAAAAVPVRPPTVAVIEDDEPTTACPVEMGRPMRVEMEKRRS